MEKDKTDDDEFVRVVGALRKVKGVGGMLMDMIITPVIYPKERRIF